MFSGLFAMIKPAMTAGQGRGQQQLPVGHGQTQIGDIVEIISPVDLQNVGALFFTVSPYDSPHIQTAPNTFVNSGCCSSMVPKHSISGRNRLSGMVGIRS